MLRVVEVSGRASVQDLGRPGHAHLGVPRSGAVDEPAHRLANRLVGNGEDAATLEVVGGLVLEVLAATRVALTGGSGRLTVAGRDRPWGEPVSVPAGVRLAVGPATVGLRTYLAVAGGITTPPVLGSRSTDQLSGLGPPPLAAGVLLPVGAPGPVAPPEAVALPAAGARAVRVLPGPRLDWLVDEAWRTLTTAEYRASSDADRVGVRLEGPVLQRRPDRAAAELATEGMVLGAIQVPPEGRPVVLLNDHPTTGGYPVAAVVVAADLPVVAQLRPGDPLRFAAARAGA
jgi:biotin-dependent carboxylase-like uncharacterized protein